MAINFPDSPGIGSVFVDTTSGFQYKWTGVVWKSFTAAAAENISELDDISSSFDNSTTTFNLTTNSVAFTPQSAAQMQISWVVLFKNQALIILLVVLLSRLPLHLTLG